MKYIKYLVVLLFSLFAFNMCVLAEASQFEPFITMDTDITENQIRVALGFSGEEIMTIKGTLAYDSNKLTLVEVEALDNFNVTTSIEKEDGKYRSVEILADSDYSFNESNYAILVFEVNSNFKTKNKSDVYLYNYEASGPDKIKYRYKGVIATLDRISASEMNFVLDNITDSTKIKQWLISHIYIFVIIGLIIIGVILIIFLLPSRRKKEVREKSAEDLLKPENYNPNENNIKIDKDAIDAIGRVEKPIDMSQAIIYDESVKPFGDIVGKFDNEEPSKKAAPEQSNNVNVFASTTPEAFTGNANAQVSQPESMGTINMSNPGNNNTNNQGANVADTTFNGFDPFHAKIEEATPQMPELKEEVTATPTELSQSPGAAPEGLTVINPQNFEEVEMPKLNEDINISVGSAPLEQPTSAPEKTENQNSNPNNPNNPNMFSIILMLIFASSLVFTNVYAEEDNFRIKDLRDCIVGRTSYDESLDYNNDGKIDVLDIIETKDLSNCSFENLLSSDPGFAEIHGKSNNLISSDSNFVTPTKKSSGKTTKAKTTKATTTKKSSGGSSGSSSSSGGKTTTAKTTTARTTTLKNTTVKNTTTKKTTTAKTTTTKTTAPVYTVSINSTNGSASPSQFELASGKSKTVTLSGNDGYTINKEASKCNNVSYSFSSTNKLMLANITGNATCNLVFSANNNVKVTLKYSIGKGNSATVTPSYTYTTKSIDNGGKGIFNEMWSTGLATPTGYSVAGSPSCGSYSNGIFSIRIPAYSTTCTLTFQPIMYNFRVYVTGQNSQINSGTLARIFYNEKKKVTFESYTGYSKVSCSTGTATSLSKSGSNPTTYSFSYTHTSTGDAECRIS